MIVCQLNLYIVPKSVEKEKVLSVMSKLFYCNRPECVDDENLLPELAENYSIYTSAAMGCNCGTAQTRFQENDENVSWETLKKSLIDSDLEHLENIKKLINQDDFEVKRKEFTDTLESLNKKREKAQGEEFQELIKQTQIFIKENELIFQSMVYAKQKDGNSWVVLKDIDDDIKNVSRQYEIIDEEYGDLKVFASEILKVADEVKFLSYWQDEYSPYVGFEKETNLKDLKIEDFIYLKYNELLTVKKV